MRGSLDLRRLRYFMAIADRGSVSGAARVLNLAQPALSYHLGELERLTGQALFERSRDGVVLTEAGRLLRKHAHDILDKVDSVELALEKFSRRQQVASKRVRVAIISSLAADLTPLLIALVARELPDVMLHIIEAGTRDIEHKLARSESDMAIYLSSNHGPGELPLATEQLFFLSPEGLADAESISLADVLRQPLVLPATGNPLRDFVETVARQHGRALDVVLEVDGSRSRSKAVANKIGGTILGEHSVATKQQDAGMIVREIVTPRLYRPIYLGWRPDLDQQMRQDMSDLLKSALLNLGLNEPQAG